MGKRVFFNPAINDTATFLKTSAETKGQYSLLEIELFKSEGPPLHFHRTFSEEFEVLEGLLYLQVGGVKSVLKPGEAKFVAKGVHHRFYNSTNDRVRFRITFRPGHEGMENFIKIIYSLAEDGLTDKKGKPNSFAHLACILNMSDTNAAGMMSLLSPVIRMLQERRKKTVRKSGWWTNIVARLFGILCFKASKQT